MFPDAGLATRSRMNRSGVCARAWKVLGPQVFHAGEPISKLLRQDTKNRFEVLLAAGTAREPEHFARGRLNYQVKFFRKRLGASTRARIERDWFDAASKESIREVDKPAVGHEEKAASHRPSARETIEDPQ